jgi:hypothetical protein
MMIECGTDNNNIFYDTTTTPHGRICLGREDLEPTKIHERTADDDSWLKIFSHHQGRRFSLYDVMIGFLVFTCDMLQQQQVSKLPLSRKILHHLLCRSGLVHESKETHRYRLSEKGMNLLN